MGDGVVNVLLIHFFTLLIDSSVHPTEQRFVFFTTTFLALFGSSGALLRSSGIELKSLMNMASGRPFLVRAVSCQPKPKADHSP